MFPDVALARRWNNSSLSALGRGGGVKWEENSPKSFAHCPPNRRDLQARSAVWQPAMSPTGSRRAPIRCWALNVECFQFIGLPPIHLQKKFPPIYAPFSACARERKSKPRRPAPAKPARPVREPLGMRIECCPTHKIPHLKRSKFPSARQRLKCPRHIQRNWKRWRWLSRTGPAHLKKLPPLPPL